MHQLVIELWRRHSMAILLVTHDVDEALAIADRLVVLDGGRISREWEIDLPRSDRSPAQPEIARVRAEVLQSLGVKPTPPNPNRNPLTKELNNQLSKKRDRQRTDQGAA